MKWLRSGLIVACIGMILMVSGRTPAQSSPTPGPEPQFTSTGILINGWYWLRDDEYAQTASWILTGLTPGTADITLNVEALATSALSGGPGVDADFFVRYGIPPKDGHEGRVLGRKHVVIANVNDLADATGFTCRGKITIPRAGLENSTGLWVIISRKDDQSAAAASTTLVAFRDTSLTLIPSGASEAQVGLTALETVDFKSTGDLVDRWYWLRDSAFQAAARWTFGRLPAGNTDLTLDFNVLGSDQAGGGSTGINAAFYLSYGATGDDDPIGRMRIELSNVRDPANTTGTLNHGSATIPRFGLDNRAGLWVVVSRMDDAGQYAPVETPLAFNEDSVSALVSGSGAVGTRLAETDTLDQAALLSPGAYYGDLGRMRLDNQRDPEDWYTLKLTAGQKVSLALNETRSLSLSLSLKPPEAKEWLRDTGHRLSYVAGADGVFAVRIRRSGGEGFYQLVVDVADQNDGGSAGDAGNTMATALKIAPGSIDGLLMAEDNEDWYALDMIRGQVVTLRLQQPEDASFDLRLYAPLTPSAPVGTVEFEGQTEVLAYTASDSGQWLIRIKRLTGAGEYPLDVELQNQNDGGTGTDAGNSADAAAPLKPGRTNGLLVRGDDEDWYSLSLQKNDQLALGLTAPEGTRFDLWLYAPDGKTTGRHIISDGSTQTLLTPIDQDGLWAVRIVRNRGVGEYELDVVAGAG